MSPQTMSLNKIMVPQKQNTISTVNSVTLFSVKCELRNSFEHDLRNEWPIFVMFLSLIFIMDTWEKHSLFFEKHLEIIIFIYYASLS